MIAPAMRELPTGTVTFLFTDIGGSTARWETDRDAMSTALARHDVVLREAIARLGEAAFAGERAGGRGLPLDEAIAYGLESVNAAR